MPFRQSKSETSQRHEEILKIYKLSDKMIHFRYRFQVSKIRVGLIVILTVRVRFKLENVDYRGPKNRREFGSIQTQKTDLHLGSCSRLYVGLPTVVMNHDDFESSLES